jgi:nicotinamidase-related amidase
MTDNALPARAPARALWQIGGASRNVARLGEAVLVVIDAQREYQDGQLPLDGIDPALDALAALLARARAAGTPVIHVVHRGKPGGLFAPGEGGAIVERAAPVAGEPIVEKTLPNAFAGTDLLARLRETGRSKPILAGFMTHNCVDATARAAFDLGMQATLVADALADRALPDPLGGPDVSAADVQRGVLAGLADRIAVVARLAEIG